MADTAAPRLNTLVIPATIDLSKGNANFTINGTATDDGSGVDQVIVWLDKNLTVSQGSGAASTSSNAFFGNYGIYDSWSDGASTQAYNILATNQNGTYNVTRVTVKDVQGNSREYYASELATMGINTVINVTGAHADTTGPRLSSLSIPETVDLSLGAGAFSFSATASDDQSGVDQVVVWLDKNITYSMSSGPASSSSYSFFGNYGIWDSWSDGTSTQNYGILATNPNGTYNVTKVTVKDVQGNSTEYYASDLRALGFNTAFKLTGSTADLTAPRLTSISIPTTIDVSKGMANFTFSATATDEMSGVDQVVVWLDKNITYSLGSGPASSSSYSFFGNYGIYDSWSDGTSTQSYGILPSNPNGSYQVVKVTVRDLQGNTKEYFASDLKALGANTTIQITGSKTDYLAPTVLGFSPADGASAVSRYDDITAQFSEAIQRGTGTILLKDGSGKLIESFDTAYSNRLVIDGSKLVINPTADLAPGTSYKLEFAQGTIEDLAANPYAGSSDYDFTVRPLQEAFKLTGIYADADFARLSFAADVPDGTAFLDFRLGNDGWYEVYNSAVLEWEAAGLDHLLLSQLILSRLPASGGPASAPFFASLFSQGETIDLQQLKAVRFTPSDDAANVGIKSDIEITFDRSIQRGTGTILLKDAQGTVVESFDVASSAHVSVIGSTLVIDPSADLSYGKGYTLELAAGTVADSAGHKYAGSTAYHFTTVAAPDATAPTVLGFSPADGATGVSRYDNITVQFSETIQRGTGTILLKDGSGRIVESFDAASSTRLTVDGNKLLINPTADLEPGAGYKLEFAQGAIDDLAGNKYAGSSDYDFTVRPLQEAFKLTNIYADADFARFSFAADVPDGTAFLDFRLGNDGWYNERNTAVLEWEAAGLDYQLLSELMLSRLPASGGPANAPSFASLFSQGETIDLQQLKAVRFTPTDDAGNVGIGSDIEITFDRSIQRGAGTIVLKDAQGTIIESFDAASSDRVSVVGSTLIIDPGTDLSYAKAYTVELASGTVSDKAGHQYAGSTAYNFTTVAAPDTTAPTVLGFTPADGTATARIYDNITVQFSEAVQRGKGTIVLTDGSGKLIESFDAASSTRLTIDGNKLLINPTADLGFGITYKLDFAKGTIEDRAGNQFAGASDYDFTVRHSQDNFKLAAISGGTDFVRLSFAADVPDGVAFLDFRYANGSWYNEQNTAVLEWDAAGLERQMLVERILSRLPTSGGPSDAGGFASLFSQGETIDLYGGLIRAGGAKADVLVGSALDDHLYGYGGDDELDGAGGNDTLVGGSGNDSLIMRDGSGTLDGGDGNDVFHVLLHATATGSGTATATGGQGQDTFVLSPLSPYVVTDFQAGAGGDIIKLAELLGQVDPAQNPFGTAGYLSLVKDGNSTILMFDPDGAAGSGKAAPMLWLKGVDPASLGAANFVEGVNPHPAPPAPPSPPPVVVTPPPPVVVPPPAPPAEPGKTISASDKGDQLKGGGGADVLNGGKGNDILLGAAGNDTMTGGDGIDIARYTGARSNYTITRDANGVKIVDQNGNEGSDTLVGVERLEFADGAIALDVDGTAGQAYRLYRAAFDRVPDQVGLGFWLSAMDKGQSLESVAARFVASAEFTDLYGAAPTNVAIVEHLYRNVLHRAPDQSGFLFWLDILDNHKTDLAMVLRNFSESAENTEAVAEIIAKGVPYQPYGSV